jgi:hypothetical protein
VVSAIRHVVEELSADERPRAVVLTPTASLFINEIEALYDQPEFPKAAGGASCGLWAGQSELLACCARDHQILPTSCVPSPCSRESVPHSHVVISAAVRLHLMRAVI